LDLNGKVVGVVVAGVRGARVNFAIPVSHVVRLVDKPEVVFELPRVDRSDGDRAFLFQARLLTVVPPAEPFEVELALHSAGGQERRFKMERQGDVYQARAVAFARPPAKGALRLKLSYTGGSVEGLVEDRAFKVGGAEVRLRDVARLSFQERPRAVLSDGKTLEGPITGLEAVPVQLGGEKLAVNLPKAEEARLSPAEADDLSVSGAVVVLRSGTEVARVSRTVLDTAAVAAVKEVLLGTWRVKVGPDYQTEWTFKADGTMVSKNPQAVEYGKWRIEGQHRVLVVWSETQWESLNLPLDPKGTFGDTHHGRGWRVEAEKVR
jgi:hypothetical protein